MSEMAKSARAASRAKANRMCNESVGKVDASDFTPAEPLNTEAKVGMRPVSRRAYRDGGACAAAGESSKITGGRKPRASGGNVKSYATEDAKAANADKFGKKHVGGFASGGAIEVPTKRLTFGSNMPTPGQKSGGKVVKKGGGSVSDGTLQGTRPTGGRMARASGGKVKKGTNINIIVNAGPKPEQKPPMPPMPPPPAPMPPPPGPPPGMPPGGPPPMPPGAGPGGPPMMRKAGGRANYMSKEAGSGSGLGRLQKQRGK